MTTSNGFAGPAADQHDVLNPRVNQRTTLPLENGLRSNAQGRFQRALKAPCGAADQNRRRYVRVSHA